MSNELEEFLRRAAQRRAAAARQAQARPQTPEVIILEPDTAVMAEIIDAEPVPSSYSAPPSRRFPQTGAEHGHRPAEGHRPMARRPDAEAHRPFDQTASEVAAARAGRAAADREEHRTSVFATTPVEVDPNVKANDNSLGVSQLTADVIGQLFHSPQAIQQAIILSEVLARPEQRWLDRP